MDTLRVLAAVAVVVVHVAATLLPPYSDPPGADWWLCDAFDSLGRWCVPIFVMISGALLLDPAKAQPSIGQFYRKRFQRIAVPLIFWTFIYLLIRVKLDQLPINKIANALAKGQPYYHMWYLYMIPGLYAVTPLFRRLIRSQSAGRMWLITTAILLASFATPWGGMVFLTALTMSIPYWGYFLLGHQLRAIPSSTLQKVPAWGFVALAGASATFIAIGTQWLSSRQGRQDLILYEYCTPMVVLAAAGVFLALRRMHPHRPMHPRLAQWTRRLAPCTLGVYLIHPLLVGLPAWLGMHVQEMAWWATAIALTAGTLSVFVLSWLASAIMLKAPYLQQTIG